jgi:hypothetical protein
MTDAEQDKIPVSSIRINEETDFINDCLLDALANIPAKLKRKLAKLGLQIKIVPALDEPLEGIRKNELPEIRYSERAAYYAPTKTIYISEIPFIEDYGTIAYSDTSLGLGRADADLTGLLKNETLATTVNLDREKMSEENKRRFGDQELSEIYSRIFAYLVEWTSETGSSPNKLPENTWGDAFPQTLRLAQKQFACENSD